MINDRYADLYVRELAKELNADLASGRVRIHVNNNAVDIYLYPPGFIFAQPRLVVPARFELKTSISFCPPFIVRKNDFIDCVNGHILLRHDFQTGNDSFDEKCFIKVADEAWAHDFFTAEVTSRLLHILSTGFDRVVLSDGNLIITKDVQTLADCPSRDLIEDTVQHLLFLSGQHAIADYRGKLYGSTEENEKISLLDQIDQRAVNQSNQTLSDIKLNISRSTIFYLCSMMLTPIALPIIVGLSSYLLQAGWMITPRAYFALLALPTAGSLLGYFGYLEQRKIMAPLLCVIVNSLYTIFLIFGIIQLG